MYFFCSLPSIHVTMHGDFVSVDCIMRLQVDILISLTPSVGENHITPKTKDCIPLSFPLPTGFH